MIKKENFRFLALSLFLSTLTACESSSSGGVNNAGPHSCTIPCLESAPTLDKTAVTSASGGTVRVTFTLRGDITNVSNVVVFLAPTDIMSTNPAAGSGSLISPTQATNSVDIVVDAGGTVAAGDYYPTFAITAISPSNSGSQYYFNPFASSTKYSYAEVVNGAAPTPVVTNFTIPVLQVQ